MKKITKKINEGKYLFKECDKVDIYIKEDKDREEEELSDGKEELLEMILNKLFPNDNKKNK